MTTDAMHPTTKAIADALARRDAENATLPGLAGMPAPRPRPKRNRRHSVKHRSIR